MHTSPETHPKRKRGRPPGRAALQAAELMGLLERLAKEDSPTPNVSRVRDSELARMRGISVRSVQRHLKTLHDTGQIARQRRKEHIDRRFFTQRAIRLTKRGGEPIFSWAIPMSANKRAVARREQVQRVKGFIASSNLSDIQAALKASDERKRMLKERFDTDPEFRQKVRDQIHKIEYVNTVYGYDRPFADRSATVDLILKKLEREREQ